MKKRLFFKTMTLVLCLLSANAVYAAKKKTIIVEPDNATIVVNGNEVGTGSYVLNFGKNDDLFSIRLEAPGYLPRTFKVLKDNPQNTITFKLDKDDARANSLGDESEGGELANKWFDVTCREGMSEDVIWKRLMNIAVTNFENIEVRDKDAGWIKTGWVVTSFPKQTVRTRLEVRMSFLGEGQISYRVRLESQIKDADCKGNSCYEKYDRLLTKYADIVQQLTTSVGSNI